MKEALKVVVWLIVIGAIVVFVLRKYFIARATAVDEGMAPTILSGDEVAVWKHATPAIGNIFLCVAPDDGSLIMGHVVGKPGMTVEEKRGNFFLSGEPIATTVSRTLDFYDTDLDVAVNVEMGIAEYANVHQPFFRQPGDATSFAPVTVPPGHIYLLGANWASEHHDSRFHGTVPISACIGQVFVRLKPADDHGADLGHGYLDGFLY